MVDVEFMVGVLAGSDVKFAAREPGDNRQQTVILRRRRGRRAFNADTLCRMPGHVRSCRLHVARDNNERAGPCSPPKGLDAGGIDRVPSDGRAALNRAVKWQYLISAPHIFQLQTAEDWRSRQSMGAPSCR